MLSSSDENTPSVIIQCPDNAFDCTYEVQKDRLDGRVRMRSASPLRDEEQPNSALAPPAPADAYPMHEQFYFPAENIYFLVSTGYIH